VGGDAKAAARVASDSVALEVFLRAGLKVEFFGAWMSARPIGSFDAYLLAGGMLL